MKHLPAVLLLFCILSACLLLPGCAAVYTPMNTAGLEKMTPVVGEEFAYAYQYNVLGAARNRRYQKKETKKGVRIIGVQFQNNTGRTINFRNDVRVYMGERLVSPLETTTVRQQIKQIPAIYLLYGFLFATWTTCDGADCEDIRIPFGLVIGLGNLAVAANANARFFEDVRRGNLMDREINDGETVSGLIALQSEVLGPIKMRIVDN